MRVQEWVRLNAGALSEVNRSNQFVELIYTHADQNSRLPQELARLVTAEQACCGAAGVAFEFSRLHSGSRVTVRALQDGLPSRTVLDAFTNMKPG